MRMTVADTINLIDWGRIMNVCGRTSTGAVDPRVYMALNRAQPRLLSRGDWIGSTQVVNFCINEACITLPRQGERIDAAMLNGAPLSVKNEWHSFAPPIGSTCSNGYYFGYGPFDVAGDTLLDRGYHATFRDVLPPGKKLRIYADSPVDVGKEVLIEATDDNNQRIIESADYAGFKMVVALPYVESAYYVSSIMNVVKPETFKNLNLYSADVDSVLRLLAIYEPGETTVELRRYQIPGVGCCSTSSCEQSLLALVKLKHIPLKRETDCLVIENCAALEEMIRSLEKKDANQSEEAMHSELNAVRELNLEKRNRSPATTIPITVRTMGNAHPWRHGVGRM